MHKLMEYVCNELEELESKADKEGKLSAAEIEYADKLTHIKKNLLRHVLFSFQILQSFEKFQIQLKD